MRFLQGKKRGIKNRVEGNKKVGLKGWAVYPSSQVLLWSASGTISDLI